MLSRQGRGTEISLTKMDRPRQNFKMQIDEHISYKGIALFLVIGVAFITLGVLEKKQGAELQAGNQEIEARVTQSKIVEKKGKKTYEVQYAFKASPESAEVTRGDYFGRTNLWSTLPETIYNEAVASGKLKVRYATSNPSNSEPAAAPRGAGDDRFMFGGGGVAVAIALIGFVRKRRALKA